MANTTNRLHVVHYHTTGNTAPKNEDIMMGEIALSLSGGSETIYTKNSSGETVTIGTNINNLAGLKKNNVFVGNNYFSKIYFMYDSVNLNNFIIQTRPEGVGSHTPRYLDIKYATSRATNTLLIIEPTTLTINTPISIFGDTVITGDMSISGNSVITGTCTSTGGFYDTSDKRLKMFDGDIDVNLDDIKNIQKFLFHFKNDETKKEHIGVYAQEIQKYYPQLVNEDENGYLTVDYSKLSVVALKAIDKLNEKNCILEEKINEIEKTLIDIKEKIS